MVSTLTHCPFKQTIFDMHCNPYLYLLAAYVALITDVVKLFLLVIDISTKLIIGVPLIIIVATITMVHSDPSSQ